MKTEKEITERLIERVFDMQKAVADFTQKELKLDYRNINELEKKLTTFLTAINELGWVLEDKEKK